MYIFVRSPCKLSLIKLCVCKKITNSMFYVINNAFDVHLRAVFIPILFFLEKRKQNICFHLLPYHGTKINIDDHTFSPVGWIWLSD